MYRKRIASQQAATPGATLGEKDAGTLPANWKSRDAVITFLCISPDFVQVNETIDGEMCITNKFSGVLTL
jgi:hypothetical protein